MGNQQQIQNSMATTEIKAMINDNAYNTWLDPYIGSYVKVVRVTKRRVYFLMDYGKGFLETYFHDKNLFDLN